MQLRECLDRSAKATPDKCPVCLEISQVSEWVQLDLAGGVRPPLRMLTITLLFTMDTDEGVTRLGHPRLLRLANTASLSSVERLVSSMVSAQVPRVTPIAVVVVKDDGELCSRSFESTYVYVIIILTIYFTCTLYPGHCAQSLCALSTLMMSRCNNFPERCRGCTLASLASPEGDLQLKPGDTLAVMLDLTGGS